MHCGGGHVEAFRCEYTWDCHHQTKKRFGEGSPKLMRETLKAMYHPQYEQQDLQTQVQQLEELLHSISKTEKFSTIYQICPDMSKGLSSVQNAAVMETACQVICICRWFPGCPSLISSFSFLYCFLHLGNEFPSLYLLQLGQKPSAFPSFFKALAVLSYVDLAHVLGWFLPEGFPIRSAPLSLYVILREQAEEQARRGM